MVYSLPGRTAEADEFLIIEKEFTEIASDNCSGKEVTQSGYKFEVDANGNVTISLASLAKGAKVGGKIKFTKAEWTEIKPVLPEQQHASDKYFSECMEKAKDKLWDRYSGATKQAKVPADTQECYNGNSAVCRRIVDIVNEWEGCNTRDCTYGNKLTNLKILANLAENMVQACGFAPDNLSKSCISSKRNLQRNFKASELKDLQKLLDKKS